MIKQTENNSTNTPNFVQTYYPPTANYFGWVFLMVVGNGILYKAIMYLYNTGHHIEFNWFDIMGGVMLLALFAISFIYPVTKFIKTRAFAVSEEGLYAFNPLLAKRKAFVEWKHVRWAGLEVVKDENDQTSGIKLIIDAAWNEDRSFDYYLGKQGHETFFYFLENKGVKVSKAVKII